MNDFEKLNPVGDEITKEQFSNLVNTIRSELGMTDHDLADFFGISLPVVEKFKTSTTKPQPATAKLLVSAMEAGLKTNPLGLEAELGAVAFRRQAQQNE